MRFTKVEGHGTCYLSRYAIVDEDDNVVSCANDDDEAELLIEAFTERSDREPDWKPLPIETDAVVASGYDDDFFFDGDEFKT